MNEDTTTFHRKPRWPRVFLVPVLAGAIAASIYPFVAGVSQITTTYVALSLALAAMSGLLLGTANHWTRFVVSPFVMVLVALSLGFISSLNRFEWIGATIGVLITCVIFVTLEIAKLTFGRFRIPGPNKSFVEAFQFSISHMMIVTAATAIFISLLQWLSSGSSQNMEGPPPNHVTIIIIFVGTHAVITLANLWALMGTRVRFRLGIATALSFISMGSAFIPTGQTANLPWLWISVFVVSWLAIVIQLCMLRFEGLRFVRRQA